MIAIELRTEQGRTVVVKHADGSSPADLARLSREATMLGVGRHPGVVEIATAPIEPATGAEPGDPDRAPAELRTIFVGSRTLATADLAPLERMQAVATAAATLTDLHGIGIVHGRVTADHLVLADSGRAVLCGFAEAGLTGERRSDGVVLTPSLDVAALGEVLSRGLDDRRHPSIDRRSGVDLDAIARLAARATASEASVRPSARAFAVALDGALPQRPKPAPGTARSRPAATAASTTTTTTTPPSSSGVGALPVDRPSSLDGDLDELVADLRSASRAAHDTRTDRPPPGRRGPTRARQVTLAVGATIAVAFLALGAVHLAGASDHGRRDPVGPSGAVTRAEPSPSAPGPDDPTGSGGAAVQPGGDAVLIDGRRFALGTPDDQVARGRWACAASDSTVLVRADGSIFRFDALAGPGNDVVGVSVGRLPPGAPVEVVLDPDGCAALQALGPDGPVTLSIPPT